MFWSKYKNSPQAKAKRVHEPPVKAEPVDYKSVPQVGASSVIPNDYIARLMYYLHCVRTCIDIRASPRLLDYQNYFLLNELEKREVVFLAHHYRPSVLRNIIFFEVDNDSYMLPNSSNNFLAFDDPTVIGSFNLASNAISIDGLQTIIQRIMIYKYTWLHDYFEQPYQEEKWRIGLSPKPVYYVRTPNGYDPIYAADIPLWFMSGILCCFFFPPVGLALLMVGGCRTGCEVVSAAAAHDTSTTYVVY